MLKGFREFVLRGNVVDLAVALVIGAALPRWYVVLTNILSPLLGLRLPDLSTLSYVPERGELGSSTRSASCVALAITSS